MEIIPGIDIKDGKCVRLYQGDFRQVTVYSEDPEAVARQWVQAGAPRLHVVDLDGSCEGRLVNLQTVRRICTAASVPVQCAGGVRTVADAEALVGAGADRVVVGTAAVADPDLVRRLVETLGGRVVVAVDARDGFVATRGWQETSKIAATALARAMVGLGARRFLYTDISRDGTLTAPNFEATAQLIEALRGAVPCSPTPSPSRGERSGGVIPPPPSRERRLGGEGDPHPPSVIASGGVASVDHLRRLARLGVEGTIVGRALYTGQLRLADGLAALAAVRDSAC